MQRITWLAFVAVAVWMYIHVAVSVGTLFSTSIAAVLHSAAQSAAR